MEEAAYKRDYRRIITDVGKLIETLTKGGFTKVVKDDRNRN